MATIAIGDIQGCYDQLMRLLEQARYDERRDVLWFVGDLVNRGPQSLATVRFVKGLGDRAVTVLGNHDLNLLAVAEGIRKPHRGDTDGDILAAPDRDELLAWLRHRKMLHVENGYAMVHAGLLPQWTISQAAALAREVEGALCAPGYRQLLRDMYGNEPARWRDDLTGAERLRVVVNAMARMRLTSADGALELDYKMGLERVPPGYMPWYDAPQRASRGVTILFGHWASHGVLVREDVVCLDSGCVWGRALSALRLDDRRLFSCGCPEMAGTTSEE
jgi:bis(5'-nucleosyl)-tetraphosphatase (symmetrical)